jgi:hypothetical protein
MDSLADRPAPRPQSEKPTIGQRFERSAAGEALISVLVLTAVLIGVVWNLPPSHIKAAMMPTLRPIALPTGLQQQWTMYGPDPISAREELEVRVSMADGPDRVWMFHKGDRVIGPFVWYHWQKLKEQLIREPHLAADFSHWVVREVTGPTERPTRVVVSSRLEFFPAPREAGTTSRTTTILHDELLDRRP